KIDLFFYFSVQISGSRHTRGRKAKDNLTFKERQVLKALTNNPDITIRSADKGGGVVLMNTVDYEKESTRLLSDTNTYLPLTENPQKMFMEEFLELINDGKFRGILNKREYDFICCKHPRTAVFYHLPKIHKSLINPPGRPIISGINSLTSNLSQYVDQFLQPMTEVVSVTHDNGFGKYGKIYASILLRGSVVRIPCGEVSAIIYQSMSGTVNEVPDRLQLGEVCAREEVIHPIYSCKKNWDSLTGMAGQLGILNKREYDFICCKHPRMAVFYHLPKIHKSLINPPGRPIISGINSLTSNLSQYVDQFLQPMVLRGIPFINNNTIREVRPVRGGGRHTAIWPFESATTTATRGDGGNPRTDYCHLNGLSAKTHQPLTPHPACNKNHPGTDNHMPTTPSSPSRLTPTLREPRGTSILKHSCKLRGTSENLTGQHEWTVS
ncbi:Hypothetical predicted protein, partial [Pelobates cultripes]